MKGKLYKQNKATPPVTGGKNRRAGGVFGLLSDAFADCPFWRTFLFVIPLRLRMESEDHQLLRVDIDEVVSSKPIQYVGIEAHVFLCRATVGQRKWLFELRYTIRTHSWCLLRKVY